MTLFPVIAADDELREVVPEVVARAAMELICERHQLEGELRAADRGSELVYAVGQRSIIKLTDPRWAAEIENEARFIEALDGALTARTPRLVGRGELEGWPYVVMTLLPGEHLADVWPTLEVGERRRIAAQLGELMAELHACPVAGAPLPSWSSFIARQRENAIEYHRQRGAGDAWLEQVAELLQRTGDPFDIEDTVTLHTELLDAHILVEQTSDGWRVAGLIDFADAMRGRPSYDIAALVEFIFKTDTNLLAITLAAAGWPRALDDDECERLFACALLHRFASLPRMMRVAGVDESAPPDLAALRARLYSPGS